MPAGNERDGNEQAELRLERQQTEQDAGERRPLFDQRDAATEQCGDEEAVLPDHDVPEHRRPCKSRDTGVPVALDQPDRGKVERRCRDAIQNSSATG